MLPQEKVSELKDYGVFEDINAFLDEFDQKSNDKRQNRGNNRTEKSATRISYERGIREFFKIVINKDIEHLNEQDLKLKKRDVINYRKQLQEKGNSNATVNQKMAGIKSLFQFLNAEYDVNVAALDLKRLDEQTTHYGKMTKDEAEMFAETAFETEREKNYMKKMLILTAIRTSFRLDELLSLTWNSFQKESEIAYKVTAIGKRGKLVTNGISTKLYNQIIPLKEMNKETKWNGDQDIVFQISKDSVNDMMDRLRKRLSIDPNRNLVFHSFRNVGINWEYENTLDIKKAAQQANHSNIDTTYKNYIEHNRDYTESAGVRMDEELEIDTLLEKANIEDFKEFIRQGGYKLQLEFQKYMSK